MKISTREDGNSYYKLINKLVDDYIDKWKIKPSSLGRYLAPRSDNFNKFLLRNNLSEIKGADRILIDIIEDRISMEEDGIIKFEKYRMFESDEFKIHSMKECLYKGIEKSTQKMEKVLADNFDTNLGHIDSVDSDKHIFKISDWEKEDCNVIIYSKEEMDVIKYNMLEHLFKELTSKKVELTSTISIDLSDLIKFNMLEEQMNKMFNNEFLIKTITDCLGDYEFEKESNNYFIWIS